LPDATLAAAASASCHLCAPVLVSHLHFYKKHAISRSIQEILMTITERKSGDVTILDVEGKILLGEGDVQLKRKIDELIERKEIKLLLNLANVPYMDSGGLGEIVRSYTTVKRAGGELKLLNATKRISDLLTITKLITVFEIFEDEGEAVKSYAA
jgi:anti-sigma B factor antagonist